MRVTNFESWDRVAASAVLSLAAILAPGAFGAAPGAFSMPRARCGTSSRRSRAGWSWGGCR